MGVAPTIDDVQPVANETRDRIITGAITVIPFIALFVVGWQLWNEALGWGDLIVFAVCYVLTGLGVTFRMGRARMGVIGSAFQIREAPPEDPPEPAPVVSDY